MPKIHFTSNPKIPHDKAEEWKDYISGSIHEVSQDEAERWLRRGNCEIVTTRQANLILKEEEVEPPPPPTPVKVVESVVTKIEASKVDDKVVDISKGSTTSPTTSPPAPPPPAGKK